jgi:hypothetical protein
VAVLWESPNALRQLERSEEMGKTL